MRAAGIEDEAQTPGKLRPGYSIFEYTAISKDWFVFVFRTTTKYELVISFLPYSSSMLLSVTFEETVTRGRGREPGEEICNDSAPCLSLLVLTGLLTR